MQDIIIIGAGGFGREVLEYIGYINHVQSTWNVLGFLDDNQDALNGFNIPLKVLGSVSSWMPSEKERYVLAIADPRIKKTIVEKWKEKGADFATIVSPDVIIGSRTSIGDGSIIFGNVGMSVDISVGRFVFINARCTIGHDCSIGDYSTIAPNACISGHTIIGKCVSIGAMAVTYPGVEICDNAVVGLGSAVIKKVNAGTTVIGVPAKKIV